MDLFDTQSKNQFTPLAERMRPRILDDIVGQDHLLGSDKVLRTMVLRDQLVSLLFWGPPGVGKTTIASVIAAETGAHFISMSAVIAGVKDIREAVTKAEENLKFKHKKTILFIDEIHRFNKAQQDALLPHVERGTVIFMGATTENPSFEVNSALLSRSRVFVLKAHTVESLYQILDRSLSDTERGFGAEDIVLAPEARDYLVQFSNGDGRTLLNALELAVNVASSVGGKKKKKLTITRALLEEALQHKALHYDKGGEEHYSVISAFIKSMRNSDANAALYWLARMIEAGEDPVFIARRMVIFASEDVGNAVPTALVLANAVFQAVHAIGMPEARINLAQGVVYLAQAKKSNQSYIGLERALQDVRAYGSLPVPLHLRNAVTKLMKDLSYGKGYQYAHDYDEGKTDMTCLPDTLKSRNYLEDEKS